MVFPAHAGMIPSWSARCTGRGSVPRTRGDDPDERTHRTRLEPVFPAHAGMIPASAGQGRVRFVFPAHAGMIPTSQREYVSCVRVPRTRGDDPAKPGGGLPIDWCSPHTRG